MAFAAGLSFECQDPRNQIHGPTGPTKGKGKIATDFGESTQLLLRVMTMWVLQEGIVRYDIHSMMLGRRLHLSPAQRAGLWGFVKCLIGERK